MAEKIGKYQIIRPLGKGATAVVYLAHDPEMNRQVAIKLIRFGEDSAAMSRRLRKIFQTEDAIGRLSAGPLSTSQLSAGPRSAWPSAADGCPIRYQRRTLRLRKTSEESRQTSATAARMTTSRT